MLTLVIILSLIAALAGAFWYRIRADISSAGARQLVREGALLVDVRTPAEFDAGHIDGAHNIPAAVEMTERIQVLQAADRPVIVYCSSGVRSAIVARGLRRAGLVNIHNLGSMRNW